ncbi:hypothetical protein CWE12_06755 [Aliidiomarina sedimenti]|uniref:Uncharacterized protein n=1 Tax=Aliidiomarina sedimenti TaxID=1933879 RepID=A0ABY0C0S3_9GAMM|nr:hypothetical protein [Aliidiomarina sedimenti]RUO30932.1 hypothetical protein CWE12_06755 [Aliidiomarina sedimenti]
MHRRGEETEAQKLRNKLIFYPILLLVVGLPSYLLAKGTFGWISGAWFEINFAHWGVWIALGITTLVYAVVLLMIAVQTVLGFMLALKR